MAMDKCDYLFKILLMGDSGVGKSAILKRFADNSFSDTYQSTIGVDFKSSTLDIDKEKVKLQIWDTAGHERFRTIVTSYYKGVHGIIIVFDITEMQSFINLYYWIKEARRHAGEDVEIFIVANKSDLENYRVVDKDTVNEFIEKVEIKSYSISAKSNSNVDNVFFSMAKILKEKNALLPLQKDKNIIKTVSLTDEEHKQPSKNCCCSI